jgi:hypothetical protein
MLQPRNRSLQAILDSCRHSLFDVTPRSKCRSIFHLVLFHPHHISSSLHVSQKGVRPSPGAHGDTETLCLFQYSIVLLPSPVSCVVRAQTLASSRNTSPAALPPTTHTYTLPQGQYASERVITFRTTAEFSHNHLRYRTATGIDYSSLSSPFRHLSLLVQCLSMPVVQLNVTSARWAARGCGQDAYTRPFELRFNPR